MRSLKKTIALLAFCIAPATPLGAQRSSAATDSLLTRLVGRWTMTGIVRGKPATYTLDVDRVLQGRFVQLHMEEVTRPPGYEARVFIGTDTAGRVIAHWMDNTGAAYSIPHAVGAARGDTLVFTFAYDDGPFRDTFSYDAKANAWHFLLETGDSTGHWKVFGDYQVRRRAR